MNPLTQNKTTNFVITRHLTEKYTTWPPTRATSRKRHAQTTKAKQTFEGTELRNPSVERHPTIQQKCCMYHFNFMPAKTLASSIRVQFKMHSQKPNCNASYQPTQRHSFTNFLPQSSKYKLPTAISYQFENKCSYASSSVARFLKKPSWSCRRWATSS